MLRLPGHIAAGATPAGTLFVPGGTITWTGVTVQPGVTWVQTFAVTVEAGYAGPLTNRVKATTLEGAAGAYTQSRVLVPCSALTGADIAGPLTGTIGVPYTFTATVGPPTATLPITYTWQVVEQGGVVTTSNAPSHSTSYTWGAVGAKTITVTAANACAVTAQATHVITIEAGERHLYLPLVIKN